MKCSKIILTNRNGVSKSSKNQSLLSDRSNMWYTTGYHGYSYKLSARTKQHASHLDSIDPQLTITTLMFPDDTSLNTGASMARWSKKTPRLTSAKNKNHTPRKNMLDDEYDFSYTIGELLETDKLQNGTHEEHENLDLLFNEYHVSSDIEELMLKSQRTGDENAQINKHNKKDKNRKRDNKEKKDDCAKKKRNKFKKTIRFSFSKPASPETEQVIRVDVTTNVSFEDMSQLENAISQNNLLKNDCSKGHGKIIQEEMKDLSAKKFDRNNNEYDADLTSEAIEEDFIVKCRQLALTQKKR